MLLLSAPAGALAQRIGPRIPLTVGPLVTALGLLCGALPLRWGAASPDQVEQRMHG
jgi:hypothetical protein